jgi:AcrR family transcriptional regulator
LRPSNHRLPRGRHGLGPELVAENQRWRLIAATAEVLAERGYAGTTARRIATCAAVSPSTFYRYFANVPAAVAASSEVAGRSVLGSVSRSCEGESLPRRRLEAALRAAWEFTSEEPHLAGLLGPEAGVAVAGAAAAQAELLDRLERLAGSCSEKPAPPAIRPALAATVALIAASATPGLVSDLFELLSALALGGGGGGRS